MFKKIYNIKDYAVYSKAVAPHMTVVGFWKSKLVKVIVLVSEYDAVDKQKCLETFGSSDFKYHDINIKD